MFSPFLCSFEILVKALLDVCSLFIHVAHGLKNGPPCHEVGKSPLGGSLQIQPLSLEIRLKFHLYKIILVT